MSKFVELVTCNICQERDFKVIDKFESLDLKKVNRSLAKLKKPQIAGGLRRFQVVRCKNCGLIAINPRPKINELERFYQGFYNKEFEGQNVAFAQTVYSQLNIEQEKGRLSEIRKFKKRGSILDIGAGVGHFLKVAKDAGFKVLGFDISKNASTIAKREFGVNVTSGKLEDLLVKDNSFDVITLHSTLEHTTNPKNYIDFSFKKLKPGGLIVFSTPNLRSLNYILAKILKLPYPGFIFEHLYYFTPKVIINLLETNFEILKITSFHHSRSVSSKANRKTKKPQNRLKVFLNEFLKSNKKWYYFRQRLYYFQMRILREFLEYNQFGGSLKLGDVIYVFARKKY